MCYIILEEGFEVYFKTTPKGLKISNDAEESMMNNHLTKPDKTRQAENEELSEKQSRAIVLVASGLTDHQIARRVGVSRQTINHWRNHDPEFMNEIRSRRRQVWENNKDKMSELIEKAIEIVKENLDNEDPKVRLQVAFQVLKYSGMQNAMKEDKEESQQPHELSATDLLMKALEGIHVQPGQGLLEEGKTPDATPKT